MSRVTVKPEMLLWACKRSGLSIEGLISRFPKLKLWKSGEMSPTLKQLESFAKATYTPIGFLFMQEPPVEKVPIPDFRTVAGEKSQQPSPDLLDTIYICQQRQEWYRDYMRVSGEKPMQFVGSATTDNNVEEFAAQIRRALGFDIEERRKMSTWTALAVEIKEVSSKNN